MLSAAAPLATGFDAPPYLQDFRLSQLPAGSLLPIVSASAITRTYEPLAC